MYEKIIEVLEKKVQKGFISTTLLENYGRTMGTENHPKKKVTPKMLEVIRGMEKMVNEFLHDMDSNKNRKIIKEIMSNRYVVRDNPRTVVKLTDVNGEFRFIVSVQNDSGVRYYIIPDRIEDMGKSVGTSISFADTEQVLDVVSQLPMFFDSRYNGKIYNRFKDIRSNIVYYDNAPNCIDRVYRVGSKLTDPRDFKVLMENIVGG